MFNVSKFAGLLLALALILAGCQSAGGSPDSGTLSATQPSPPVATTTPSRPSATPLMQPSTAVEPTAALEPSPTAAALHTEPPATTLPPTAPAVTLTAQPTAALPATQPADQPTAIAAPLGKAIIVDHTSVALFDQIPEEYLEKARNLRVVYYNASVGNNLSQGLDCLASPSWAQSPAHCRRDYTQQTPAGPTWEWRAFTENDLSAGAVPARIQFPGGPQYDRRNWVFERYSAQWQEAAATFLNQQVPSVLDKYDVLSYKITYFMVDERSDILDPQTGFFASQPERIDVTDLEAFSAAYPGKVFFFWTSSLSRTTGSQVALDFNQRLREYAAQRGLILFDLADVESHTDAGAACFDNRDGVEYCSNNGECENFPDDGLDLPAICQDYTTEIEGGHLGSVSAGKIQLAKAFWVLMARIAGWNP